MTNSGQIWITRRLDDIIGTVEEAAGDIDTRDYPNFQSWMMDVFDSALNRLHDESYQSESNFLDKYSGILSAMEDMFKDQLEDFYLSEKDNEVINESSEIPIRLLRRGVELEKIGDIVEYQTEIQDPCDFEDEEDYSDFCILQGIHFYYCDEGYCDEDEDTEDYEGPSPAMVEVRDEVEQYIYDKYYDYLVGLYNDADC
jgi:hypothetical protein